MQFCDVAFVGEVFEVFGFDGGATCVSASYGVTDGVDQGFCTRLVKSCVLEVFDDSVCVEGDADHLVKRVSQLGWGSFLIYGVEP